MATHSPVSAALDSLPDVLAGTRCMRSPRYRGLGNAVTVSTVQWILERIVAASDVRIERREAK